MSNELAVTQNQDLMFEPQNLTKDTIKRYLCPLASEQELMMGLQIAKTFGLNPLKREVYFVKYRADQPMQVLTGYEVYLKRAERSGKYAGMRSWTEGSVEGKDLKGCVELYKTGWEKPLCHEADYSEYVQVKHDGTPNRFWKEKPKTMIKKVAISQAFRMAFPDEFDGMPYTRDEVIDEEKIVDVKAVQVVETPKELPAETPKEEKKQNLSRTIIDKVTVLFKTPTGRPSIKQFKSWLFDQGLPDTMADVLNLKEVEQVELLSKLTEYENKVVKSEN